MIDPEIKKSPDNHINEELYNNTKVVGNKTSDNRSEVDKFVECFKKYAYSVTYNKLGMLISIEFKDGSKIGAATLMKRAGFDIHI